MNPRHTHLLGELDAGIAPFELFWCKRARSDARVETIQLICFTKTQYLCGFDELFP
jgi:hypothetical protein